jgi:acetyltransferase-like isoleucine patch superfamily enzyme
MSSPRTLPWDWYHGTIPDSVELHESSYLETSYSFMLYRHQGTLGLQVGAGASVYNGAMFDVGPGGRIRIGDFSLINPAWFICDSEIDIGAYALIAWNVVLMDSYRLPVHPGQRRIELRKVAFSKPRRIDRIGEARPIRIGQNVWIGFDSCVLPGVTIGEGSVIGARSVVTSDIPPYTIAAGNPARVVRHFSKEETEAARLSL